MEFSASEQRELVRSLRNMTTAAALRAQQQSLCGLCGETMEHRNLTFHLDGSDVQWTIQVQICDCENRSLEDRSLKARSLKDRSLNDRSVPPGNRGKRVQ
jgi:hypothetical protein